MGPVTTFASPQLKDTKTESLPPTMPGLPVELCGPKSEVGVTIEGIECTAVLDSGSQVTVIFKSFYWQHLTHLPLQPLTRLAVWGLADE